MSHFILIDNRQVRKLFVLLYAGLLALCSNNISVANEMENRANSTKVEVTDKHDDHEEDLQLSDDEIEEFDVKIEVASNGSIDETLTLPGEIMLDPGRMFHIVPRVSGISREVFKRLGDQVSKGELLATLSSRELAEIRAELEAARSRYKLASVTFERERKLKEDGITSEREFLEAQQARDNAYIELDLARQKLKAIGVTQDDQMVNNCNSDCDLTLYEIRSPGEGVITDKHIVHGELLNGESLLFTIANMEQVWVNITVYQKDLNKVHVGQRVRIISGISIPDIEGVIDYISPTVSEQTRSATARVIIDNIDGNWRPGLFITAVVTLSSSQAIVVIPKTALETLNEKVVIFVKTQQGFEPRPVMVGREDDHFVEVVQGLNVGEEYVAEHAFVLKAQMQKESFGDDH